MRVVFKGQLGGSPIVFRGYPYQRGSGLGSIFKGLLRMVLPLAKQAGKAIGKEALVTGANVARDVAEGQDIVESLKLQGRRGGKRLVKKGVRSLTGQKRKKKPQSGGAVGRAPPRRTSINKRAIPTRRVTRRKGVRRRKKAALPDILF